MVSDSSDSSAPRNRTGRSAKGEKGRDQELDQFTGEDKPEDGCGDLTGEYGNIALLMVLYTLQGIPMGLSAVMPLILKERNVSFSDLGTFSLNSYPFSLKLLWAPIVDASYIVTVGRRKTWMVPSQLLIGVVMIVLSMSLENLLYVDQPQILPLTALFFLLYFLCATQDIAVDGWALTMLRKENVGYAATCNSVGQTLGYAMGFTGFMALEHFKLATLPAFMFFWGVVFIVVTLLLAVGKTEKPVPPEDEPEDIPTAYRQMIAMLQLRPVRTMVIVLFTWKAGFAIVDSAAPLKFQEYGMPKEHMAYMTSLLMPVYILLPVVVARWTSSSEPFDLALKAYPFRAALVPLTVALAYCTPIVNGSVPWGFYTVLMLASLMGAVASQCMFVSQMAFFARVSDPAMGGTYMTLLNTISNLGGMWPPTVVFKAMDYTTCKTEDCAVQADGFYVMAALCTTWALVWYLVGTGPAHRLQHLKLSEWRVR